MGALNKQATLDPFFDLSIGQGNYAPRRRTTANVSKRLMAVIKQYREAEARLSGQQPEGWGEMMVGLDEEDPKGRGTGKRRKSETVEEKEEKVDEEVGEEDEQPVKKRRASRGRPKRTASSASKSEVGTESVGSSAEVRDATSQRGRRGRAGSRGRGRGRGRGSAVTASISGEVAEE